jgi:hypothetical protein
MVTLTFSAMPLRVRCRVTAASALLLLAIAGCEAAGNVIVPSDEPFLYVALTPSTEVRRFPGIYGVLATTGTPISAPYRAAQRFDLLRASDGARFGWEHRGQTGTFGEYSGGMLWDGNYFLGDTVEAGYLSAQDIRAGEEYDILVETDGVTVRGSATVPAAFALAFEVRNGARTLFWPPVPGAGGYVVEIHGVDVPHHQTATSLVLPDRAPEAFRATVHALDPSLYRYIADESARRAGIDRGYGVFGAYTSARLSVVP